MLKKTKATFYVLNWNEMNQTFDKFWSNEIQKNTGPFVWNSQNNEFHGGGGRFSNDLCTGSNPDAWKSLVLGGILTKNLFFMDNFDDKSWGLEVGPKGPVCVAKGCEYPCLAAHYVLVMPESIFVPHFLIFEQKDVFCAIGKKCPLSAVFEHTISCRSFENKNKMKNNRGPFCWRFCFR